MFLTNPFPGAFGLDIGDLAIKLVLLSRHRRLGRGSYFKIEEVRSTSLPPGLIVNGEIEQPEIVRKKILHLLGRDGSSKPIKSSWVVADLPEPKTFLKLIEIELPEKELLYEDVAYFAKKHVPFELEETYLDWQVMDSLEARNRTVQVLIAAVPKIIADSYTYLLESVGLTPLAFEIEAMPLARTLITHTKDYTGQARVILDLGATRSSFVVYDFDRIQFSTNLDFSGELVTTAISQGLKIDHEAAEKLKIKNGLEYDKEQPRYLKMVSDLVEGLIEEIKKNLSFYKEHFRETNPITHITMSGGLAELKNLDVVLSQKLRIPAQTGNAWKNIGNFAPTAKDLGAGLSYASAIGLAMRAASNPFKENTL
ncbi:MAG TPA: type IV pilus assembly protein PilM [Patescibacteria group bacterium]|nr:type IV pilus assembly protein PilM [Patescibacteria group bacterium]